MPAFANPPATLPAVRAYAPLVAPPRPSFTYVALASLLAVSVSLLFFLSDFLWSNLPPLVHLASTTLVHLTHTPFPHRTSFAQFTNPHPLSTQTLDPPTFLKLLSDRRKLRGGLFKNTLIAACSDNSATLSTTLLSWNRLRHVRELIIIDHDSTIEGPLPSLRLVHSIDNLGRVVFVTAAPPHPSSSATPPRIGRARALNLAAAMASGSNLLVLKCNTKISPWLLPEHPLTNRTFYTAAHNPPLPSPTAPLHASPQYSLIYVTKRHFFDAGGFDERLDIPGAEFSDLATRLRKVHRLRRLSMDSQMVRTQAYQREESIVLARDSSLVDTRDVLESARRVPELSQYISSLARRQLPPWNGSHADGSGTMLRLGGGLSFEVLRRQVEGCRHGLRGEGGGRGADYRLWVRVRVGGGEPRFMLDLLDGEALRGVLVNAHRRLLHHEYMVPWNLLRALERHLWREGKGVEGGRGVGVAASQVGDYAPLLFDVVWRKKKLLVVNVEVEEAMELMVAVSWAVAYAVSKDRSLVLVGRLAGVAVADVLDFDGMMDILHREYNLKLSILGVGDEWDCRRGRDEHCWSGDVIGRAWDEYNLTREPSGLRDNGNRHDLFNIVGGKIGRWEGSESSTGLQRRLQKLGFASVSVSRQVGERMGIGMDDGTCEAGLVLSTGGDANGEEMVRRGVGEVVREVGESKRFGRGERRFVYVSGVGSLADGERVLETRHGRMEVLTNGKRVQGDGLGKMGDLWRLLGCRRIGFAGREGRGPWNGSEDGITEWRRVHHEDYAGMGGGVGRSTVGGWEWMVFEEAGVDERPSDDVTGTMKWPLTGPAPGGEI